MRVSIGKAKFKRNCKSAGDKKSIDLTRLQQDGW